MPREIENHERIIEAFRNIEIVSELVEQLPNGEFRNELDMDIILFGRSYGNNKKVGPYARLLEFAPDEIIIRENTWESNIFYILVRGLLEAVITDENGRQIKVGEISAGNTFGEMAVLAGTRRTATVKVAAEFAIGNRSRICPSRAPASPETAEIRQGSRPQLPPIRFGSDAQRIQGFSARNFQPGHSQTIRRCGAVCRL